MSVSLTFLGAAGTVTGSKFLIDHPDGRLLVDCGLYQGERHWRRLNWEPLPVPATSIGNVVLTHAHLDHTGYLPALVRQGFEAPVWATPGTTALLDIVLRDSGRLQEEEASYARMEGYSRHDPPLPLYTEADARLTMGMVRPMDHGSTTELAPGATVSLTRAGHVLGSASALLRFEGESILFSGDLGRPRHPLLMPRATPPTARVVVIESTYGDVRHSSPVGGDHEELAAAIRRTIGRGGSVVIPAFAVDRTEIVLLAIGRLREQGRIPDAPVYVDSPMALAALEVYRRPDLAGEMRPEALLALTTMREVYESRSAEESKRLNNPGRPCIIVSASGMATGGRVVHHLASLLPHRHNCVVLTGYQAVGTRGRALQDGAKEIKIHGRYVRVRADVVVDDTFSVHADAGELLEWLEGMSEPPETVYVVHGEPEASRALADRIRQRLDCAVAIPRLGEKVMVA
jgi:metallo-beta-lactamase family protein